MTAALFRRIGRHGRHKGISTEIPTSEAIIPALRRKHKRPVNTYRFQKGFSGASWAEFLYRTSFYAEKQVPFFVFFHNYALTTTITLRVRAIHAKYTLRRLSVFLHIYQFLCSYCIGYLFPFWRFAYFFSNYSTLLLITCVPAIQPFAPLVVRQIAVDFLCQQ